MLYLLASIFSSSMIYVVFKIAKNHSCSLSSLITYNYLAATLLGIILFQPFANTEAISDSTNWLPFGIILGILFILMFFLIGTSSQKAGITVTTLANKLSLVFPVLFSILYFNEEISTLKYIGLAGACVAVILTVYKKDISRTNLLFIILPVLIFFGSGLIDSIVKYVQAVKISSNQVSLYTIVVFMVAFICGVVVQIFQKQYKNKFHLPTLYLGVLLGLANFGSLFFFIEALNKSGLKSSLVFAINNMSIVALTALLGTILFKERLNKINFAGVILAIISLYFLL